METRLLLAGSSRFVQLPFVHHFVKDEFEPRTIAEIVGKGVHPFILLLQDLEIAQLVAKARMVDVARAEHIAFVLAVEHELFADDAKRAVRLHC